MVKMNGGTATVWLLLLIGLCLAHKSTAQVSAPTVVAFTGGTLTRTGANHTSSPPPNFQFTYRFTGEGTDVNGLIGAVSTTGLNWSEVTPHYYGQKFVIADFAEGSNSFSQNASPVIVNGVEYTSFWYRGSIRFNGSAIVPRYLKKKSTQIITIPITVTGNLTGYPTFPDRQNSTNAVFNVSLTNLKGVATYTIRSHEAPPENHFDIVSVTYDLSGQ